MIYGDEEMLGSCGLKVCVVWGVEKRIRRLVMMMEDVSDHGHSHKNG